ncbi:MAG: endonuclease/exonuclease/phosphatase family protein [Candidatus Eisenbacteria bacterium]|nr:endonuclease/exonuclease/phosphatase family protein [Candidatus Eisenbacteria bacterium]
MARTAQRSPQLVRLLAITALVTALISAAPATCTAVRVVTYNVLNFPGTTGTAREDDFRTVLEELDADVLIVQEMLSQAGVNQFLNNVLNYGAPGTYAAGPFVDGPDTDNALFYRVSTIEFLSSQQISTSLRNISEYVVRPVGYGSAAAEMAVYSMHLKAGSTTADEEQRLGETTILRNHMNALPDGSSLVAAGDFNIRGSDESAYQKLVGSEADNSGRLLDPLDAPGYWHDNASFAWIHTQSPRTEAFGGGATGGMDDRFDQLLVSYSLYDGEGMDYVPGSYVSYGNDSYHFNTAINVGTNYAVGPVIADALHDAADHLPVYMDFQVPARISAPSELGFGDVIVGSPSQLTLPVGNISQPPADELDCTVEAPAGFSAAPGLFQILPGETANRTVSMNTSSPAERTGTLEIASDDVDNPTWLVSLSGNVLSHAVPSLSDSAIVLSDTLDFGAHVPGGFAPGILEVDNLGFQVLQASLEVYYGHIEDASGRFSFAGGFQASEVGSEAASYQIVFDDQGAAPDSLYRADLTLGCRDCTDIQGWSDLDSLNVHLTAYVQNTTSVGEGAENEYGDLDFSLRLDSANPTRGEAALLLTMPSAGTVAVRIYDVTGRIVRTLQDGAVSAGTHGLLWNGKSQSGAPCASGVYLIRASSGNRLSSAKLVLIR